jgi:TPR repeat protein
MQTMLPGIPNQRVEAAASGDPKAQFDVGLYYYRGEVIAKDIGKAEEWWQRAAKSGDTRAQSMLGNEAYARKDIANAVRWWKQAAENGDAYSQYHLAVRTYEFKQYQITEDDGYRWLESAANSGYKEAQVYLGYMMLIGVFGRRRNRVTALKWLALGAQDNPKSAPKNFYKFVRLISSSKQVAEAERLANEWSAQKRSRS